MADGAAFVASKNIPHNTIEKISSNDIILISIKNKTILS